MSSQRNAKYKGTRLVEPRQDASKYVCIDEVYLPVILSVNYSAVDYNQVLRYEPRVTPGSFLASSPLMLAFWDNFKEFRARKVEVSFESMECGTEHPRVQSAIYWVPNHFDYDNQPAANPAYWSQVLEQDRMSIVHKAGGKDMFHLQYIPQLISQEDIEEDNPEPAPDFVFQVRGDFKYGWCPTTDPAKQWELRAPVIYFRRPYRAAGPEDAAVKYQVTVRVLFEFRNARTDV